MRTPLTLNRLTRRILRKRGIDTDAFLAAVETALHTSGDASVPQRVLLSAAMCAQPGGSHCDLGGGLSLYLLIWRYLGMSVTVIDLFETGDWKRFDLFKEAGITLIQSDLYCADIPPCDSVSMLETIEHLPHSPEPILRKAVEALSGGGRLVMSTPNACRVENRGRMLAGRSPMGSYARLWSSGIPYTGHHRELTMSELRWIPQALGMEEEDFFTTDMRYRDSSPSATFLERLSLNDVIIPPAWRRQLWVSARKPSQCAN